MVPHLQTLPHSPQMMSLRAVHAADLDLGHVVGEAEPHGHGVVLHVGSEVGVVHAEAATTWSDLHLAD